MTTHPTSGAADLPEALTADQWLDLAIRHANKDWNSAQPDGYANAVKALCADFAALTAQAPNQPGGFSSGDMASAAAQGYRDGWAAAQAISAEPAAHVQNPTENEHVAGDVSKNRAESNMGAAYAELPDSLICAVDQWFADNIKDSDGCTTQDVRELAEIFYGVTHEGGRESVDDALAIVKSFGPGIGGINDTYARQVLLAEEVERLRGQATNAKKTGELLMGLAVIRELTGTQQKGLEETIEAVRAAVNAQKHPPAPATLAVNDDLPAIQRYKIGYHSDDWGQRSSTPSGIPDASGSWVRYADHVAALAAGQAVAPALLSPTEQKWVLQSPVAIAQLLSFIDIDHSHGVSVLGPEECEPWPPKRYTELREIGRAIIAQDPECFDAETLRDFGVSVARPTPPAMDGGEDAEQERPVQRMEGWTDTRYIAELENVARLLRRDREKLHRVRDALSEKGGR